MECVFQDFAGFHDVDNISIVVTVLQIILALLVGREIIRDLIEANVADEEESEEGVGSLLLGEIGAGSPLLTSCTTSKAVCGIGTFGVSKGLDTSTPSVFSFAISLSAAALFLCLALLPGLLLFFGEGAGASSAGAVAGAAIDSSFELEPVGLIASSTNSTISASFSLLSPLSCP